MVNALHNFECADGVVRVCWVVSAGSRHFVVEVFSVSYLSEGLCETWLEIRDNVSIWRWVAAYSDSSANLTNTIVRKREAGCQGL